MEESERICLIEKLTVTEKIFSKIIQFLGYGFGCIGLIPNISFKGITPGYRAFHNHSVIIPQEDKTYTIREKAHKNSLASDFDGITKMQDLLTRSTKRHPNKYFYGKRIIISKSEHIDHETSKKLLKYEFGDFRWTTYGEAYKQFELLSASLHGLGFDNQNKMTLFANTSPEWLLMAYALMNISSPFGTVYSTLADESILFAFNLIEAVGVFVDERTLPRVIKMSENIKSLKYIIIFSYLEPYDISSITCHNKNITIIEYTSLLSNSFKSPSSDSSKIKKPWSSDLKENNADEIDELALIMFTSGSTGIPKGVMISHRNILSMLGAVKPIDRLWKDQVYAAFLPSSHIFEFMIEIAYTGFGATIGYCTPLTLFDTSPMIKEGTVGDLVALKPTFIVTVPLLLERLKKGILDNLKRKSRLTQILFQTCFNMKMFFRSYGCSTLILDALIFKKLRNIFGGQVHSAIIGGAYCSFETEKFIGICLGDFKQGYGLTETCAGGTLSDFDYYTPGNIGPPIGCCEIMLVPWEEGGCDPNSKNEPKGEIAIHGTSVTMGYYKNEPLTKECFKKDPKTGKTWFYTGDIGRLLPDGTLRIVDRKKDIIKLQHGEYVSLVRIESHISQNNLIEFICIVPSTSMEFLVALIIPNRERCREFLSKKGFSINNCNLEEYITNSEITDSLINNIKATINDKSLNRHEIPQKIYILPDVWSPENNLITPSMKLRRVEIAKCYNHLLN